jgi:flavin-dependent dehydrogenase
MPQAWDFDVAVIGGGPGGSSAASALARRGRNVVLLERLQFPRFHIGESQLPWINGVLEAIGASDVIGRAGFVQKWGASFMSEDDSIERYADFSHAPEVPQPQTWQVPRERFDQLLLEHAAKSGADVRQNCQATSADFDADGVTIGYSGADGRAATVRVKAVIDASGRYGFLARKFGQRRPDPTLKNIAVHRQYTGVPRLQGRRAGDIRIISRVDGGWFWLIPISETIMSVGVVMPQDSYRAIAQPTPDETLDAAIASSPSVVRLLARATPATRAQFEADYSYLHSCQAGDRFVLVGDAGAFLDPIFSTGVLLAMQSGLEAAEAISAGLKSGKLGAAAFRKFERTVERRYAHFRRFAVGFYDPAFRDFFLSPSSRFGLYEALLSVLAGNWRPGFSVRARLRLFYVLVALQRTIPLVPRQLRPRLADHAQ